MLKSVWKNSVLSYSFKVIDSLRGYLFIFFSVYFLPFLMFFVIFRLISIEKVHLKWTKKNWKQHPKAGQNIQQLCSVLKTGIFFLNCRLSCSDCSHFFADFGSFMKHSANGKALFLGPLIRGRCTLRTFTVGARIPNAYGIWMVYGIPFSKGILFLNGPPIWPKTIEIWAKTFRFWMVRHS